ncbi:MAG: mycofactocin biosynthesis glycosyltransferase MftF, partial [Ktedonobacteraceae bacterium]
ITLRETDGLAICDYPLRVVRLSTTAARLLQQCNEQHTCEQLAAYLHLPLKRVEALCEQLRWKGLLEAGPMQAPTTWPGVSIIVPSHNRVQQLERCLCALRALDYPAACVEILVVDDGSNDETSTMLQRLTQECEAEGRTLRVVRHTSQLGVAKSRNTGAQAAQYDLLAYIDSDCVASPGWLTELVPAFQQADVAAVGGMIRAYERLSMLGRYEDMRSSLFMGVRPQQVSIEGPLMYLPTANLLVRKEMWQQLGGFAPLTFGEDVDFCRRLLATKARVLYMPQGIVYHDYRTKLWSFLKIRASYASAEAALLRLHPEERRILHLPPEQAIFSGLMLGGLWSTLLMRSKSESIQSISANTGPGHPQARQSQAEQPRPGQGQVGQLQRPGLPVPQTGFPQGDAPRGADGRTRATARARARARPHPTRATARVAPTIYDRGHWGWKMKGGSILYIGSSFGMLVLAMILTGFGAYKRWRKVKKQGVPIGPLTIFRATLRGHLAYTYHLCRHLTRYYTLPLLIVGVILPPLLLLVLTLVGIVVGVDYVRLQPAMRVGEYALCAVLDDCAYEVGVIQGCIKHGTWKPLWPIIKR